MAHRSEVLHDRRLAARVPSSNLNGFAAISLGRGRLPSERQGRVEVCIVLLRPGGVLQHDEPGQRAEEQEQEDRLGLATWVEEPVFQRGVADGSCEGDGDALESVVDGGFDVERLAVARHGPVEQHDS